MDQVADRGRLGKKRVVAGIELDHELRRGRPRERRRAHVYRRGVESVELRPVGQSTGTTALQLCQPSPTPSSLLVVVVPAPVDPAVVIVFA